MKPTFFLARFAKLKRIFSTGTLSFWLQRSIYFRFCTFFNLTLSSSPYISGDTFKLISNVVYLGEQTIHLAEDGNIIFTSPEHLECLLNVLVTSNTKKYFLITHHSDIEINLENSTILHDPNLIHWFAQNNTITHHKITSIPIGLEDLRYYNNGVVSDFTSERSRFLITPRLPLIAYGFNDNTNLLVRLNLRNIIGSCSNMVEISGNSRHYRHQLARHMFVVSPQGNGIDCHRTWEALYLGVIPIVVDSHFYSKFPDFPGVVLSDWDELTDFANSNLISTYRHHVSKLSRFKHHWLDYYLNYIHYLKLTNHIIT